MKLRNTFWIAVAIIFIASWYVFSRFTVDDAFITWRYGKNLTDVGIWNYNPSSIDMTQAYTNPIYAVLSIFPNYLRWDVVLFFKAFSTILLIGFLFWSTKKLPGNWLMVLLFLALPASIVHIYSGLETFLFVWLMAALMIALYEDKKLTVISLSLLLFVTRPETWLLLILIPLYYFIEEPKEVRLLSQGGLPNYLSNLKMTPSRTIIYSLALGIPLAIYFYLHKTHFGSALPNTFYVKSGAHFSFPSFIGFSIYLIPLAVLFVIGRPKLGMVLLAMFGAMVVSYSTSSLQMNYAGRFAFHIFAPIFIFLIYLSTKFNGKLFITLSEKPSPSYSLEFKQILTSVSLIILFIFFRASENLSLHLATYYPRALESHARLGKILSSRTANVDAFSLGDAGMAAYQSRINALDNIGLGSSAVARNGVDDNLLESYNIKLIALHASPQNILLDSWNQRRIYDWAIRSGFNEVCDIYWQKDYTLRILTIEPNDEIIRLCKHSKSVNDRTNKDMFRDAIFPAPWTFWHE